MMFGGFLLFVGISWCKLKSATNTPVSSGITLLKAINIVLTFTIR